MAWQRSEIGGVMQSLTRLDGGIGAALRPGCEVRHRTAAVLTRGILLIGAAFAQVSTPNPTQSATVAPGGQTPLFRVTAEQAQEKRRGSNDIMMPARQAAAFVAEQRRIVAVREQDAVKGERS
jgi:hypothetical protein